VLRWLLVGYMYLFIHRPFEIWPSLGAIRFELLYALLTGFVWLLHPGKRWLPNSLHKAFFAFVGAVLICWLTSPWMEQGYFLVDKYLKMLFVYVLLVTIIHEEDGLRKIAEAFLVIMAIYMLHSVWEFRNGRYVFRMGIVRLIGVDATMNDPNSFAATLLYALALVPALWVGNRSRLWRSFLVFYMLLTLGCVALTGSRAAAVVLVFWAALTIARSRWRLALGALAVAAAPLMWAALPESLQNRFETIINPEAGPMNAQVSAQGRLEGFWLGMQLFQENPLTGCGPGVWRVATQTKLESHNLYGQLLGELGLVGAVPFAFVVLLFWLNARWIARRYREHPEWGRDFLYHFGQCLGVALLLLLLNGNFGHNLFRYTWLWYGAFLIIARYCVEQRLSREGEPEAEAVPSWEPLNHGQMAWNAARS
jgi:O-antigen ligase